MPIDIQLDPEDIESAVNASNEFIDGLEKKKEAREVVAQEAAAEETQAKAELEDPREKENWGIAAFAKEGQSILSGGIQDTASSITTFPERTIDALTGEISRERKEKGYYRPEWDPFVDEENPIETKTWWGKLLRGTVHFGTMAAAIIPTAKYTAARLGITGTGIMANSLFRAGAVGATSDLISKESDGHNALGMLREKYGWIDTPLTTKETDHPIMMKLKNILEGIGIGTAFDGVAMLLGRGSKKVINQIQNRNESITSMDTELAVEQIRKADPEFRASKNRPVADRSQGAYTSEQKPYDALVTYRRINREYGAKDGSVGRIATPIELERIAREGDLSEYTAQRILKSLLGDQRYQAEIGLVKAGRKTLMETWGDAIESYQKITLGRDAGDMSPEEFLQDILRYKTSYPVIKGGKQIDSIETLVSENIVVADLLVGSLLHQLRDYGISGREIADMTDLGDIDGPAAQVIDTMLYLLRETKKARIVKSNDFRAIGAGKQNQFLTETLTKEMADTRESIMSILKIAKDDPDPALMNALFEVFSSMKTVHSVHDFDNWARKMIRGGSMDPSQPNRTGALIRELGAVMTNSILSGIKTPVRAVMGTATATFMKPMATTLGAAMRYPFTGDTATLRAGISSMNAMMESIPDAYQVFKTRLDSYWSGDIASIKTRFYDFTKGDENWELLRRFYEDSGRATVGDRALFAMANMARNLNNNKFLTYSTRVMAATDDTFAYMLGRAKAREKAMRKVLDIQSQGGRTPEITPEVMRAYEQEFYGEIWDQTSGELRDEATKWARKEVTLQTPLEGFSKGLNDVFAANPWAKPFFLFARTGVSGLTLTAKHTPGFNFLVKEFNDVARATADNLEDVAKYGITTPEELANAKALQTGRLGIGSATVAMTSWAWMSGRITGNGPVDRQKRQMWIDAGWRPRQFKLGGVWIGYDAIEPFNQIFSTIADIGDYSLLMGDEWTENQLQKVSLVIAQAISSKSYFAGIQQMVDMVAGRPGQQNRILANLLNNQIPLAGLRNDLGKLFTPYMRELNSGIGDSIRNRNLISEYLPGDDLPIKYDILNGKPIKDYDFMTRAFNTVSPVSLNLDQSPGRKLLFDSGYDIRLSTYMSPDNIDLSDHPRIRSMFQRAIGKQNLEYKLTTLANQPKIQASLDEMYRDIRGGNRGKYEDEDYYHNMRIDAIFQEARRKAWASIMRDPRIEALRSEKLLSDRLKYQKQEKTRNILSIPK